MSIERENEVRIEPALDQDGSGIAETSLVQRDSHRVMEHKWLHWRLLGRNPKLTAQLLKLILEANPAPSKTCRAQSVQHCAKALPPTPTPVQTEDF